MEEVWGSWTSKHVVNSGDDDAIYAYLRRRAAPLGWTITSGEYTAASEEYIEIYESLKKVNAEIERNERQQKAAEKVQEEANKAVEEGKEEYSDMAYAMAAAMNAADNLTDANDDLADSLDALNGAAINAREGVQELAKAYQELSGSAEEAIRKQAGLLDELEIPEMANFDDFIKALESQQAALADFEKNQYAVLEYLYKKPNEALAAYVGELLNSGKSPIEMAAEIAAIADKINSGDTQALNKLSDLAADREELLKRTGAISDMLMTFYGEGAGRNYAQFSGIEPGDIYSFPGLEEYLEQFAKVSRETPAKIMRKLEEGMSNFNENISLPDGGEGKASGWWTKMFEVSEEEVTAAADKTALQMSRALSNAFENIELSDTGGGFEKVFDPMIEALIGEEGSVASALTTVTETVENQWAGAAEGATRNVETLVNEGLVPLEEKLGTTQSATEELTTATTTLGEEEDTTKGKTNDLKQAVIQLASTMASKIATLAEFASAIANVGNMAAEAANMVAQLAGAIQSLESKQITIGVNYAGGAVGGGAPIALPVSTGGYITQNGVLYRADGGNVFRPVGTDTVPAMLTPGEFVVNRRSVSAFGLKFMEYINKLDIKGAFNELMYSFPRPEPFMPVYNTVNNTRDDHRQFHYNPIINGGGAAVASQRYANRWFNAL